MYIETTSGLAYNSKARLASPYQDATGFQRLCLSFFYHMYGDNINSLRVYLKSGGDEVLIFSRSYNQGNEWFRATVLFSMPVRWQIIFEGRKGTSYKGDIAIDDISFLPDDCPPEDYNEWTTTGWLPAQVWGTTPGPNPLSEAIFVETVYNFSSPNFPRNYPNQRNVTWLFSTIPGSQLLLTFHVLDTEKRYDRVTVGNGNTVGRLHALQWSGRQPESEVQFLSNSNSMWINFYSDSSITYQGFAASVEVVKMSLSDLTCDGFICASDGVCIPRSSVCDHEQNCLSDLDENNCQGYSWNTEQPGWYTEQPGNYFWYTTSDPIDEIILTCGSTSFQVDIPMRSLPRDSQPDNFYFTKDPSCRGFQNDNYITLNSSLTGCGTVYIENTTTSSYVNSVGLDIYGTATLPVICDFDRSEQLQSHFRINTDELPQGPRIKRAKGAFLYDFSMYTNDAFNERYNSYPVETTFDRFLYFRAHLLKSPDNLQIHLRSCRATPSHNFDDAVAHEFITNGCAVTDDLVRVLATSSPVQADFVIKSSRFTPAVKNMSQVWIHCEVVVCDVNDFDSECRHDCGGSRHRRSLTGPSKEAKRLMRGPILFQDKMADLDGNPSSFIERKEEEINIFSLVLIAILIVMFLSLLIVGGALFKTMRRLRRLEHRPPQNEKYTTL